MIDLSVGNCQICQNEMLIVLAIDARWRHSIHYSNEIKRIVFFFVFSIECFDLFLSVFKEYDLMMAIKLKLVSCSTNDFFKK